MVHTGAIEVPGDSVDNNCNGVVDEDPYLFFTSRRRHTSYIGDWSSDVCSSDLVSGVCQSSLNLVIRPRLHGKAGVAITILLKVRSEERRVGKECRGRGSGWRRMDSLRRRLLRHGRCCLWITKDGTYRGDRSSRRLGRQQLQRRGRRGSLSFFYKQKTAYELHR